MVRSGAPARTRRAAPRPRGAARVAICTGLCGGAARAGSGRSRASTASAALAQDDCSCARGRRGVWRGRGGAGTNRALCEERGVAELMACMLRPRMHDRCFVTTAVDAGCRLGERRGKYDVSLLQRG